MHAHVYGRSVALPASVKSLDDGGNVVNVVRQVPWPDIVPAIVSAVNPSFVGD